VRIAALYLPYGEPEGTQQWMLVQVARSMAHREDIFKMILIDTLLPLSALIPLMTMIVWAGTGAGLAPLLRLRKEVEGRSPIDLAPLQIESAPQEVRSLVRVLNELLASVRQNVSAQKRFIADAAHQLRTPLAGLKSQTALAIASTNDPALIARLKLVDQSATRGAHLINQLLMLARADPEVAMANDMAPLNVTTFVQEIVAEFVPRALRARIDLGMDDDALPDGSAPLQIKANALLLREALTNVLDNAIKYTGSGSEITVQVKPEGNHILIIISDNGPGIAEADRARVFERFVRATDHGEGCGLGLSIVRDIVAQHGGTVTLRDAKPHGLQVVLDLPKL
jgi:two-component system sensor histidine kinase TctE